MPIQDIFANFQKNLASFQANMQAQRMQMMGQRSTLFSGFGQSGTTGTTTGTKPEGLFGFGILPFAKLGFMSKFGQGTGTGATGGQTNSQAGNGGQSPFDAARRGLILRSG